MFYFYVLCAGVGSAIMVVQFVITLLGFEHHGAHMGVEVHAQEFDAHGTGDDLHPVDHGASWYFGVLSIRTCTAALAFFGLVGVAASSHGFSAYGTFLMAVASGAAAMVLIAWLMRGLYQLKAEGNVHIENAVGQTATVYLGIPGNRSGVGKVTVKIQGRTMEYSAMTPDRDLPTGAPVVVVGVLGPDMLEVSSAAGKPGQEGE